MNHLTNDTLSDYVLGLLPPDRKRDIERHISACNHCREALLLERALVREIQQTVQAVPMPTARDLLALMPDIPVSPAVSSVHTRDSRSRGLKRSIPGLVACWQPAIAMVTVLILFLGGMMISRTAPGIALVPQGTNQLSTVTQESATSTLTALSVAVVPDSQPPTSAVILNQAVNTLTPIPNATPIAQLIPAPVPNR